MARDPESVLRHYWNAFFAGGLLSLTRLATGFGRAKYLALVLGTTGVGLFSQAMQLQLLGIQLGSLAIGAGIVNRMGAAGATASDAERRLLRTAFTMQIAVSLTMTILAVAFLRPLTHLMFGARGFAESSLSSLDVLAVIVSVPLAVVASGFLEPVFIGGHRYDLWARMSSWAAFLGFLVTITIVSVWRLPGAFWSLLASSAVLLMLFLARASRVRPSGHLFRIGFDLAEAGALVRFSVVVLVSNALVPAARLWVQRHVIASLGADANGLLQVPFAASVYYGSFLTNALWGRMYPAVSRLGPSRASQRELTAALRLTIITATAAIVALLFLKDVLVPLVYSRAFLPAARLLPAQLLGDYFYFIAFSFSVYVLGLSKLRAYLVGWVVYTAIAVAASFALIPTLGLVAVPVGYGLSGAVVASVSIAWFVTRRADGIKATMATIVAGLVLVASQSYLAWQGRHVVIQGSLFVATSAAAVAFLWNARASSPGEPLGGVPTV